MNLRSHHPSLFSPRLQNMQLPKSTTQKLPFTFVKTNDYYPLSEFEPLPSGLEKVVLDHDQDSTMLSHDESLEMENRWAMEFCEAPTIESDEKDSQMSMRPSSLKYHAHSMQLQSQACLVHRAHTRPTTTSWSSSIKLSGGWL